jgi:aminopeptidase N
LKKGGLNNIAIHYKNEYDKDGNGCVSFLDVDGKQYLYTQFEPYFANRVFPHFDQPDLKAPMSLVLSCPSDWDAVLSNENTILTSNRRINVSSITNRVISSFRNTFDSFTQNYEQSIPKSYKITAFKPTLLLPSYLYCFVVGPYKELLINTKNQGK